MTTARESMENALTFHQSGGRIRSWARHQHGSKELWLVELTDGQLADIRTLREGKLFCAGLATAHQAEPDAGQVARYIAHHGIPTTVQAGAGTAADVGAETPA